jgi:lipoyl(octanoyl) transferase
VPCGITDKAVTSIQVEKGEVVNIKEVQKVLIANIVRIFGMTISEFYADKFTQV